MTHDHIANQLKGKDQALVVVENVRGFTASIEDVNGEPIWMADGVSILGALNNLDELLRNVA